MNQASIGNGSTPRSRIKWVDYAKGICIIFVVMMWSTLDYGGVVGSEGWLHHLVAFARPFRMPDFFLLAGLFLSASINSPRREYIDRKVVHFIYFYLLWLVIQMVAVESELLLADPLGFLAAAAFALVEPTNTLWFVHMLAIFYIVTRLLRRVSYLTVFAAAAILQTGYQFGLLDTGWTVADRFFDRYIYFFTGFAAAPLIFSLARYVAARPALALGALLVWAVINAWLTSIEVDQTPGISLLLGFAGAAAVVAVGSLLSERSWAGWLAYCGQNSIVIYLTAFLPMKVLLKILASTNWVPDVGTASAIITFGAVAAPLAFHYLIKNTPLNFLYVRPRAFRLQGSPAKAAIADTSSPQAKEVAASGVPHKRQA